MPDSAKILCGMSGGVDSSLTAMRLRDMGYDVTGGSLVMHEGGETSSAREACESLGIPFAGFDCRAEFEERVSGYLVSGYSAGRTPSPCVVCNRMLKLEMLCRLADSLDIEKIATGHYAGVGFENGRWFVYRSPDPKKDQSYFLGMAKQEQLSRLVLPLAGFTKAEVRELALEAGLKAAEKRDSQELCFIDDGDYAAYIEARTGKFPEGDFIAPDGSVAGRHKGIIHYTVGQRKGLGIALGRPVFVSRIDAESNRVYLSDAGGEFSGGASLVNLNFQLLSPPAEEHTELCAFVKHRAAAQPIPCRAVIHRSEAPHADICQADAPEKPLYNKKEENSGFSVVSESESRACEGRDRIRIADGDTADGLQISGTYGTDSRFSASVYFDSPARAVTPGQFCTFYDEKGRVLFCGEIARQE